MGSVGFGMCHRIGDDSTDLLLALSDSGEIRLDLKISPYRVRGWVARRLWSPLVLVQAPGWALSKALKPVVVRSAAGAEKQYHKHLKLDDTFREQHITGSPFDMEHADATGCGMDEPLRLCSVHQMVRVSPDGGVKRCLRMPWLLKAGALQSTAI